MKLTNALLALLFLVFAFVQYNDPDPWLWIAAYGLIAILFIAQIFRRLSRPLVLGILVIFSLWGLIFIPDFLDWLQMGAPDIAAKMKATEPHIELVREFLGLVICLSALLFLLWQNRKSPNQI